jgi:acetyl-CoA synthetase
VQPVLLDDQGNEIEGATARATCASRPGRADAHGLRRPRALRQTYFATYKGYYFTGDGCRRDEDGYYWITGRVDDVINVSGHRMGTAEVESAALVAIPTRSPRPPWSAIPHDVKGQGIYAYVTLMAGEEPTDELRRSWSSGCARRSARSPSPDLIQWAPGLPKTRSGKIMRRILRKIAENETARWATPRRWPIRRGRRPDRQPPSRMALETGRPSRRPVPFRPLFPLEFAPGSLHD